MRFNFPVSDEFYVLQNISISYSSWKKIQILSQEKKLREETIIDTLLKESLFEYELLNQPEKPKEEINICESEETVLKKELKKFKNIPKNEFPHKSYIDQPLNIELVDCGNPDCRMGNRKMVITSPYKDEETGTVCCTYHCLEQFKKERK